RPMASVELYALSLHDALPICSIAVLQSARSSGYRPFAAIFSLPLSDAQNAAVMAALKGRSGVLAVTYHACASVEQSAALTLTGRSEEHTSELQSHLTLVYRLL